ncbi:hypothetical protein B0H12DRAFT_1241947 [Mycena haematopus]|nr:hypothetical protein B0H12DRAFT_1242215 [Mycena haematopus]KAJ7215784.1 hypothetical protein B0H12DRAFT_1241947 [Mycena haematopus]
MFDVQSLGIPEDACFPAVFFKWAASPGALERQRRDTSTASEAAAEDAALRRTRVAYLDRLRYGPRLPQRSPPKPFFVPPPLGALIAVETPRPATYSKNNSDPEVPDNGGPEDNSDPEVRETDAIGFPAFHIEPDWSEASEEDEYDPAGGLPYCPRWNISTRRAAAMCIIASRISPERMAELAVLEQRREMRRAQREEVRRLMRLVAAQILEVGDKKRSRERADFGIAPHVLQ